MREESSRAKGGKDDTARKNLGTATNSPKCE
jgi:hypothetical protein